LTSEGFVRAEEVIALKLLGGAIDGVPAADRIVLLNDNQRNAIDEVSGELHCHLTKENSIDGDAGLRDRFLSEISAARELVRAQSVRAYLLYETVVSVLVTLIDRYKGQALGQTAKKLLDLLIEHVLKN
jgi:hypothetical protein